VVTLGLAILVNLGLLAFAALAFHAQCLTDIADLQVATETIAGGEAGGRATSIAATIFALGLLALGLSSTFTGTIVGQVVMEGFLELKIPCWLRRVITRGLALVPALVGVIWLGRNGVGNLLEASQVTLAVLLPFALAPLILLSGDRMLTGPLTAPRWVLVGAWMMFGVLVAANGALVWAG
jgi:manganese transport protein